MKKSLCLAVSFSLCVTLAQGQVYEQIHSFAVPEGGAIRADLTPGGDDGFYGTASSWGNTNINPFGYGTIFRVTPGGAVAPLVSFNNTNGASPRAALTRGSNGDFYGTTYSGGISNLGTVFKVTTNGTLTTLVSFTNANGAFPQVGLAEGEPGIFYGATSSGGSSNSGTIFKIDTNGALNILHEFNGTNGASPRGTLVKGLDGSFYGTTYSGGENDFGTVFKVTTNGALTTLVSFGGQPGSGRNPQSKLVLGEDGLFYGTTFFGGASNFGTLFRVNSSGVLTTLISFSGTSGAFPGAYPQGGLVEGGNGNLYGTTSQGGAPNLGTLFQLTPAGGFTSLLSFTNAPGGNTPLAGMAKGADGHLYGTTLSGGNGIGTIYRLAFFSLNLQQNGNEAVVSWPTNAVGFVLQSALSLNSSTNWVDDTNAPAVLGAKFVVTNSITGGAQFYRLKK